MASLHVLHILRTIKERGSVSRTELQQITGLSWGTITNTTRELLSRNLIREEGSLKTRAGRKPVVLCINTTSHALVGLDITPHKLRCLSLGLAGETLWSKYYCYEATESPETVLAQAVKLIQEAIAAGVATGRSCLGIGVSVPGSLDLSNGVLRFAPSLPAWNNVPVRDYLQASLNSPVIIEHDSDCTALAERWFGAAGAVNDVLCVLLGEGVGVGILANGQSFRGSQGLAGEFGHMTVDPDGPQCACGNFGCVEAYCSLTALVESIRRMHPTGALAELVSHRLPMVNELQELAVKREPTLLAALDRMGKYLGLGIANAINLLNPSLVVLCGPMAPLTPFLAETVEKEVKKRAWKHSDQTIRISTLGADSIAMGACGAVLQRLFDHEEKELVETKPLEAAVAV